MNNIEWRAIGGYEGLYEVSNTGLVRGLDRQAKISNGNKRLVKGVVLKTHINKKGYIDVHLNKNNKKRSYQIHRLVALAFLPNDDHLPQINHKNGCKFCNEVSNLEWVDAKTNTQHAFKTGLHSQQGCSHRLAVAIIDTVTGDIFCTIKAFSDHLGISYSSAKRALSGDISYPKAVDLVGHNYQRYIH